ncbi:MAG: pyruvate dehydrogenase complex E1 component subunit beta [Planctomycetota bacterium]|nr:pyruvate dehydrogenase complex E1 component subunit beta [Planctomycetota bacterium]
MAKRNARAASLESAPPHRVLPPGLKKEDLLRLYERMLLLRRFESTAQEFYRAGRWPGFIHLYIGEEATAVGVCANLRTDDWITSTHRGHGHVLAKGVPPGAVMAELLGKTGGCCGGRGGSMHMYCPSVGLFGTTGIVASGIPSAVGTALSAKVRGSGQVAAAFFGDGATNHAAFLESINFATVQKLPVLFVCENNLYATQTALTKATANTRISSKAAAFGCVGVTVDGNDVLAVWEVARTAVARARAGEGPTLIESLTYRWCGHHEGDPPFGGYRTEEELNAWKERCPIAGFRKLLVEEARLASAGELEEIDRRVDEQIREAIRFSESSPDPDPDPAKLYDHVYAEPLNPPLPAPAPAPQKTVQQGWMDAVRDGIAEEMRRDQNIIYLGEGIAERGGCFGHSKDLWKEFGSRRVIDTPICELAFTGAATGAAATGCRAVADLMFADFMFDAATQIIHMAGKLRYMSNGQLNVPLLVRAPMGMIKCAGAHHSGAYYPAFAHCPGLIVVVPSNPADAKGLMKTSLRAGDPVLFLEHKALFSSKGEVPVGEHLVPLGQAAVVRPGKNLTIATCGLLTRVCLEAAEQLEPQGVSCEVIDLRTIVPLDVETVAASLHKTQHLLVVDEAWSMFGVGSELAAAMMEYAFDDLDAPVGRLHTQRVPFPFSPSLESTVMVTAPKVVAAAQAVLSGRAPVPRMPRGAGCQPALRGSWQPSLTAAVTAPARATAPAPATATAPAAATADGVPILIPNMDLTIEEARIIRWKKGLGQSVRKGESVLEVETDKSTVEIESPANGVLVKMLAAEGDVVALGKPVGLIKPG